MRRIHKCVAYLLHWLYRNSSSQHAMTARYLREAREERLREAALRKK